MHIRCGAGKRESFMRLLETCLPPFSGVRADAFGGGKSPTQTCSPWIYAPARRPFSVLWRASEPFRAATSEAEQRWRPRTFCWHPALPLNLLLRSQSPHSLPAYVPNRTSMISPLLTNGASPPSAVWSVRVCGTDTHTETHTHTHINKACATCARICMCVLCSCTCILHN